jgi:hypothetical protein
LLTYYFTIAQLKEIIILKSLVETDSRWQSEMYLILNISFYNTKMLILAELRSGDGDALRMQQHKMSSGKFS